MGELNIPVYRTEYNSAKELKNYDKIINEFLIPGGGDFSQKI